VSRPGRSIEGPAVATFLIRFADLS